MQLIMANRLRSGIDVALSGLIAKKPGTLQKGRASESWAECREVPQLSFSLDRRLGARAGFKRNEQMLTLDPRYVVAFPGNGVHERLVIDAKIRRITVVDRRGPGGTDPKASAVPDPG